MFFIFHEHRRGANGLLYFVARHAIEADTSEEAKKHPIITWEEEPVRWVSCSTIKDIVTRRPSFHLNIYLKSGEFLEYIPTIN